MSINIDMCIENAAKSVDATNGTHPADEIKARALTSIAHSLLAIAAMMHKSMFGYHLNGDTVASGRKVEE